MHDNEISHYRALYEELIKLSSEIRFVAVIDFDGKLSFREQRAGISNYLDPKSEERWLQHALEAWRLRERFSESIGSGKYAFAEYEKIKRIVMPIDKDHLIIMTTEVSADHNAIIKQLLRMKNE